MTKIIVDSFAWIEYLTSSDKGEVVRDLIEDANNEVFTHILSLAEISSRLLHSKIEPQDSINKIILNSVIININNADSINAGKMHSDIRKKVKDFGLIDAFVLLIARKLSAKVLTGDPHFKGMNNVVYLQ